MDSAPTGKQVKLTLAARKEWDKTQSRLYIYLERCEQILIYFILESGNVTFYEW